MARARITDLKLALAEFINAAWDDAYEDRGENDTIETASVIEFTVDPSHAGLIEGRKVCIIEAGCSNTATATRGQNQKDYEFQIDVMERYTDGGIPPDEWLDERKEFVVWLEELIGNPRTVSLLADEEGDGAWPQEGGITVLYDMAKLANLSLFHSIIQVTFREHAQP